MDFKLKKTTFVLMTVMLTFVTPYFVRAACNNANGETLDLVIGTFGGANLETVVEASSQETIFYELKGSERVNGSYSWKYNGFDLVGGGGGLIFLRPKSTPQVTKVKCTFTPTDPDWSGSCFAELEVVIVKLVSETLATIPVNRKRLKIGACEKVKLILNPSTLNGVTWSVNSGTIQKVSNYAIFTAKSVAGSATVTATYKGKVFSKIYNVVIPSGEDYIFVRALDSGFSSNSAGALMFCNVFIKPLDVSFQRLLFKEEKGIVKEQSGFFGGFSKPFNHKPAGWQHPFSGNRMTDTVGIGNGSGLKNGPTPPYLHWSVGKVWLEIPNVYKGDDGVPRSYGVNADQIITIKSSGEVTVSKQMGSGLKASHTRTP